MRVNLQMLSLNLIDPSRPRYQASINLDNVGMQFTNAQYLRLLELAEFFSTFSKLVVFDRPSQPVPFCLPPPPDPPSLSVTWHTAA